MRSETKQATALLVRVGVCVGGRVGVRAWGCERAVWRFPAPLPLAMYAHTTAPKIENLALSTFGRTAAG